MSPRTDDGRPHLVWVNQFALLPSDGGGTRHFELGRELVRRGWRVTVVASDFALHARQYTRRRSSDDHQAYEEELEGVRFVWLHTHAYDVNNWRRLRNWASFVSSSRRASNLIGPASVVIGSSPQPLAAIAGFQLAKARHAPFVLEVRDLWPETLQALSTRRGLAFHGIGTILRFLYARAQRVVVLAKGVGDTLVREGHVERSRVVYAPNGVDPAMFLTRGEAPGGPFTAVYAGAHGPLNGLETVLDAAELLRERLDIRFLLVGDGPSKAALQAAAHSRQLSNVEFLASTPKRDMPALLARCHAGLMVLRDTPLFAFGVSPNKLFDYLGAGLPVVCNVPGDVAGMVADAHAGEQAADASARALADAVVRLAATPSAQRADMGRSGQEWVRREHARDVVAEHLDAALRALLP